MLVRTDRKGKKPKNQNRPMKSRKKATKKGQTDTNEHNSMKGKLQDNTEVERATPYSQKARMKLALDVDPRPCLSPLESFMSRPGVAGG